MAGRKHHLQQMGYMGKNLSDIKDPMERDFAFRSMQTTPYCKHCGEVILQAFEDKHGQQVDAEWEMKNLTHYHCFLDWQSEEKAKAEKRAREEEERRKKEEANFDWDAYMKDMLAKKGE
jgi:hypothetical protein